MQPSFEHAAEETLELYSLGILPEGDTEPLEEHLLICVQCQEKLAEVDVFVKHMRAAAAKLREEDRRGAASGPVRRRAALFGLPAPAWAAIAVCCLLGVLWVVNNRNSAMRGQPQPVAVVLHAVRGAGDAAGASAPLGRPLKIEADLTGLVHGGQYELELVDDEGKLAQRSVAASEGGRAVLLVSSGLRRGAYWVRLYAAGPPSELLREYALRVQ